ncbi:cell division protein FtsX [Duganella sp. 1224]|uniref:FtsX-like permease family protein n=1 Tax=Duganella sp. 1224 TaxID=2587052 RepID=UPI0015CE496D|nr:FtsX-like permease family protein [Duganella sp. 1224]NYE63077.1 cell division protein FtsX [Duganella sp. 1224]
MSLRDFRIGWRLLLQQPGYSLVVTGGLAIGFAACFLLFGFVQFCLNYNSSVPDIGRVFLVKQRINVFPRPEWQAMAFLPLRDVALASGMVEEASIAKPIETPLRVGSALHGVNLQVVDPAFRSLFAVATLEGDLQAALTQADGIALTVTGARKLFGGMPALGRAVDIGGITLQVRALLRDPAANSTQLYEALVGPDSSAWSERATAMSQWVRGGLYLKLKPGASVPALTALLQQASDDSPLSQQMGSIAAGVRHGVHVTDIGLLPLGDAYFDDDLAASRTGEQYGRRASVYGLLAGGLLILALATINYVNLATVRTLRRQREIGIRKLLGVSAWRLTRQFLSEAMLTALLAASAGLLLAWLLLPMFSDLVNRPLEGIFTLRACMLALALAALTGVCAGAYPAWLAHRALPGPSLAGRGNSETAGGWWGRRVLTVLQFASAMALSATAIAVAWQTWYASHASPGFDPANLLVLILPSYGQNKPLDQSFIAQLRRLPQIEGVATISEAVGRDGAKNINRIRGKDGTDVPMEAKYVSADWFQVHRLRPEFGVAFDPQRDGIEGQEVSKAMVNAAGALALGYATPQEAVGKFLKADYQIIGIAPDVRFQGVRAPSRAVIYFVRPASVLSIRVRGSVAAAYDAIAPLWQRHFPDDVLELKTQQAVLAERYAGDARLIRILVAASAIAVALAGFGIYVLSAYSVQRRRREIVLRKLHGARRGDIALMMAREFAALVGAGAALGLPLAWLAIQRYLASYAEHAPLGAWPLAAALALAVLIALLATARHTLAALRISPALALQA